MPPSSSLRACAAPSASLLRFLRSQSALLAASSTSRPLLSTTHTVILTDRRSLCTNSVRDISCQKHKVAVVPPRKNTSGALRIQPSSIGSSPPRNSIWRLDSFQPCRSFATRSRPFLRRIFDLKRSRTTSPSDGSSSCKHAPPALFDDGTEGNPFNIGRNLAAKASNEPRLRCTEFDNNGNVTLVNGEFRKSELIAKYGLLPRDLRKIDSSTLPHILVRPSAILINLLHLRVLIKADRVLVFDAYGSTDSYMQSLFVYDLEGKLRQKQQGDSSLPYEFRALEAVLISVTTGLEEEFNGVREPVVRVLRALEEDIDRDKLRHLLIYSKKLGSFEQKARLVREAIDDLLEADDDLTAMYLTERARGVEREEDDHQEVEMLLESYHKVCDEIVQASSNLVTSIRNTEEVVKAILDANRNSLMLLDLKFSIGTLGLATGTLFSALYGMNLKNFIEESDLGFGAVSVTCFAITGLVCIYGLAKLRKLQRVRMWGEAGMGGGPFGAYQSSLGGGSGNRHNWRADSVEPIWGGFPGEARAERMKRLKEGAAAAAAAKAIAADVTAQRAAALKASGRDGSAESQTVDSLARKGNGSKPKDAREDVVAPAT